MEKIFNKEQLQNALELYMRMYVPEKYKKKVIIELKEKNICKIDDIKEICKKYMKFNQIEIKINNIDISPTFEYPKSYREMARIYTEPRLYPHIWID